MITRVYIDNFRCFSSFEVRPKRLNLLIGRNGAGKSTFLEVLHNVVGLATMGESVEQAFPWHTRTRWDNRPAQLFELDVSGDEGTYQYSLGLSHDLDRQTVTLQRESVKYSSLEGSTTLFLYHNEMVQLHNNEGRVGAQFPFRGTRSFLSQLEARPENRLLTRFLDLLREVWLLKLTPTDIDPESLREADFLDPDGSNFASWYRHLSQERPEDLLKLFERLGQTLPGFRALRTLGTGKGGRKRELVATFGFGDPESKDDLDSDDLSDQRTQLRNSPTSKSKYEVDFDDLSDGERATIVLYCILMDVEGRPRTLLLDEPENFVGLQLIQPWLVELADAMRDEGQLFLVSHHPEVIDYLAADESLLFERPAGGPSRVRSNPFDRDKGIKASELVSQGLLDAD